MGKSNQSLPNASPCVSFGFGSRDCFITSSLIPRRMAEIVRVKFLLLLQSNSLEMSPITDVVIWTSNAFDLVESTHQSGSYGICNEGCYPIYQWKDYITVCITCNGCSIRSEAALSNGILHGELTRTLSCSTLAILHANNTI